MDNFRSDRKLGKQLGVLPARPSVAQWEEQVRANCERGWPADWIERKYTPPDWNKVFPLLGGPPVWSSEDIEAYTELLNGFTEMLEPRDKMGLMLTKEAADATWEAARAAREKNSLPEQKYQERLRVLVELQRRNRAAETIAGKPATAFDHSLGLRAGFKHYQGLDIAQSRAIKRRDNALRQIARWRDGLGAGARRLSDKFMAEQALAERYGATELLTDAEPDAIAGDSVQAARPLASAGDAGEAAGAAPSLASAAVAAEAAPPMPTSDEAAAPSLAPAGEAAGVAPPVPLTDGAAEAAAALASADNAPSPAPTGAAAEAAPPLPMPDEAAKTAPAPASSGETAETGAPLRASDVAVDAAPPLAPGGEPTWDAPPPAPTGEGADAASRGAPPDEAAEAAPPRAPADDEPINWVRWLTGAERYPWVALDKGAREDLKRSLTTKLALVQNLVLDRKVVRPDQVCPELAQYLPAIAEAAPTLPPSVEAPK